jgi:hypothetical protein
MAPAGQAIQGRSFRGPAGVLRYPSTSPSFELPGSITCYTALNRSGSAKLARSVLTELLRPHGSDFI